MPSSARTINPLTYPGRSEKYERLSSSGSNMVRSANAESPFLITGMSAVKSDVFSRNSPAMSWGSEENFTPLKGPPLIPY